MSTVPTETTNHPKVLHYGFLWRLTTTFCLLCLLVLAAMTAMARVHPWFELASHFSLHFLLISFCFLLASSASLFLRGRFDAQKKRGASLLLSTPRWWMWIFLTAYFAWFIRPWVWVPQQLQAEPGKSLRVISWNVWHDNYSFEEIKRVIRESDADIVALFEVNARVAEALREFEATYASSYWEMESPASVVVLSRVPNTQYDLKHPAGFNMPALEIQVPWPPDSAADALDTDSSSAAQPALTNRSSSTISLFANHTKSPTPFAPWRTHMRDEQLRSIAEWSLQQKGPAMVLGDLNTSPWSPSFRDLLRVGGLRDTRVGVGNQASWPSHFGKFGIPIDHFLINDQLIAHRREIVRTFRGSDHSAIAIEISIRP